MFMTKVAWFHIIFFPRGASIQFDEKPANVIANSADASESDSKEDEDDEKEAAHSEEWVSTYKVALLTFLTPVNFWFLIWWFFLSSFEDMLL